MSTVGAETRPRISRPRLDFPDELLPDNSRIHGGMVTSTTLSNGPGDVGHHIRKQLMAARDQALRPTLQTARSAILIRRMRISQVTRLSVGVACAPAAAWAPGRLRRYRAVPLR